MPSFRFSHPIEVRYADLDPQRHVNNAAVFTYLEQARAKYLEHLGLWGGGGFDDLGVIVAAPSAPPRRAARASPREARGSGEAPRDKPRRRPRAGEPARRPGPGGRCRSPGF